VRTRRNFSSRRGRGEGNISSAGMSWDGSVGVLECWSVGALECWSVGVLGYWSVGGWEDGRMGGLDQPITLLPRRLTAPKTGSQSAGSFGENPQDR
jgi:hypothetical protein